MVDLYEIEPMNGEIKFRHLITKSNRFVSFNAFISDISVILLSASCLQKLLSKKFDLASVLEHSGMPLW